MKIYYDLEKNYFYGKIYFSQVIEEKEINIDYLYFFNENGFNINWSISQFGFGQFSIEYNSKEKTWYIDNEFMEFKICSMLVDTLEKAIFILNDEKLNNALLIFLKKLKSSSLKEGLKKIWKKSKTF